MSKLLLLYSTIVVSMLFMHIPDNDITVKYPFATGHVKSASLEYYIFSIFEKFVLIALAYVVASEAVEHRRALHIFLWLMVADLADLILTYNSIWFHVGDLPVSLNVINVSIFGVTIFIIWMKGLFK